MKKSLLFTLFLLIFSSICHAHQQSTAYLNLEQQTSDKLLLVGSWQASVNDLDKAVNFDKNQDNVITWHEITSQQQAVLDYLNSHFNVLQQNQSCKVTVDGALSIDNHFNQSYIHVPLQVDCPSDSSITVNYTALFDIDEHHQAIAAIAKSSRVFEQNTAKQVINFKEQSFTTTFIEYVHQGILHIWMGTDHILFLIALLLGCVLVRKQGEWQRVESKKQILIDTAWIITAFTLAHSLTLTATAMNIISPNTRWVELGIALSVLFAAINNIWPMIMRLGWITFCFGLLHCMGFASVLGELGLSNEYQLMSILAFNLGVEIGQLVILAICLPLLMLLRNNTWYKKAIMPAGSVVIAIMAIQWSIERF
ncbi:HupE/UreJ family protein [Pseudoalteromonas sp. B5MOD-1]|uniref:HupE/UreJ family protein n=1 Tax=Pseudoalteromonas sp. P80D2 TaxID=3113903 RepID=UPI002FC70FCB